jgi:uncharacterized Zn-binding protein involved in type VI secretion
MDIEREIETILRKKKHPDPRLGSWGKTIFHERKNRDEALPRFGIISDNKDPLCLGRVRVFCDTIAPGSVTPWIPIIRPYAAKDNGFWYLPDIGTQVILGFIGNNTEQAFVIGCIYDQKNLPPKHSTEDASQSIIIQSKHHRIEMIDEDKKESIMISTMKGQMRLDISKEKGIQLINELGGINIKCRKLTIESEEEISLQAEKNITIQGKDALSFKSKKKTIIENKKEVRMKAQCIKLQGSQGISTEGKQIAAEGDKVMGFDVHNMQVPAGLSTVVVPLPHPYMGKLVDKLSKDVKINNHNAAVKGSKSKHDDAMHMQLPGTIKFMKNPNKEGEVTGGTGKKLKINGKEAALIASTLTTCNDVGVRDNSTILAVGAAIPMPMIINPKNMEAYQLEREEQEKKKPEFTTVKWNKTEAKEGEMLELSAQVKDINDGNMITFQIWKEGQDPNNHVSHWKIPASIESGTAKAMWEFNLPSSTETIPENDPQFFFSAHSAWCPFKKSRNAVIKLKRPKLSNPLWKDKDNNNTNKVLVGEIIKLSVECNDDTDEGSSVSFRIFNHNKQIVNELSAVNKEGKAETEWLYDYHHDPKNPPMKKPKFIFSAKAFHSQEVESGNIEIGMTYRIIGKAHDGKAMANTECKIHLSANKIITKTSDLNGEIILEDEIPGVVLMLEYIDKENKNQSTGVKEE